LTTKDKILDGARKLFNIKGIPNVSVRDICGEVNISAGNFSYHFPSKDTIVVQLYQKMLQEIGEVIAAIPRDQVNILFYLESHKQVFHIQIRYKFIYLNLYEVLSNYPEIRQTYLKNHLFEREMASELLNLYVSKGVLKKGISVDHFERMLNVGQILNNAWLVDAEIQFKNNKKGQLAYYMKICCGILEPHLTEASLKEYHRYFKNL
jgi:AcrR family transcriptional regulator